MNSVEYIQGDTPLLISIPHMGTSIPESIAKDMTAIGRSIPDTDWHLDRLYDFADALGAHFITPHYSRYVIDLNRKPGGEALYPGLNTTTLVPLHTFAGEPIYEQGHEPSKADIAERVNVFWKPYHRCLKEKLDLIKQQQGFVILFEAHSILSQLPLLFDGQLPDLNIGTHSGQSCSQALETLVKQVLSQDKNYRLVVNDRFKGGYITRHYGCPTEQVHSMQLELVQSNYLSEQATAHHDRFEYDTVKAERLQQLLKKLIEGLLQWRPNP